MNFLAHLYLSSETEDNSVLIGNFIADFIKGSKLEGYNEGIVKGIKLHREIDTFTDTHSIVTASKSRLHNDFHHFAGVIVDMYYDHFLAKNWSNYSDVPLYEFADKVYATLMHNRTLLPESVVGMLPHMISGNWLVAYATLEGLDKILKQMSRRITHTQVHLDHSIINLKEHYLVFENEFKAFFPEIIKHVSKVR